MSTKVVFFDLDKTLIVTPSIESFAAAWGFEQDLASYRLQYEKKLLQDHLISTALIRNFKGKSLPDIHAICQTITLSAGAKELIDWIKQYGIAVCIVSAAYSPVVKYFGDLLGIQDIICPNVEFDALGYCTGKLLESPYLDEGMCCGLYVCKKKAVQEYCVQKRWPMSSAIGVGDGKSDACLFEACGTKIGYQTDMTDIRVDSLIDVSRYVIV